MPYSYNGWYASPNLSTRPLVVAGEAFVPGVLDNDDVYTVLQYVAEQMHERVEPIVRDEWHQMDDWGYNYRATTNDNSLSCHASGTAIDYNATRHPYNVPASANFSSEQIAEIRKIVEEAGVIRWGGEWATADAMHFEIQGTAAEVAAAARRLRNTKPPRKDEDMPLNAEDKKWIAAEIKKQVKAGNDALLQVVVDDSTKQKVTLKMALQRAAKVPAKIDGTRKILLAAIRKEPTE